MAQSVVSIAPTTATFTAGTGSANSTVTTMVATMSPPTPLFAGTWSLSGPDSASFRINASTGLLTVGPADVVPGTYAVDVTATP